MFCAIDTELSNTNLFEAVSRGWNYASSGRATTRMPMLLQVPTRLRQVDSSSVRTASSCFMSAISYRCFEEITPASVCPGRWLPSSMLSAFFIK